MWYEAIILDKVTVIVAAIANEYFLMLFILFVCFHDVVIAIVVEM